MNYRNNNTGEVITQADYLRLPEFRRHSWSLCDDEVSHSIGTEDDDFVTALITGASILGSIDSDNGGVNRTDNDSPGGFEGFSGGDFGGGGATGDW